MKQVLLGLVWLALFAGLGAAAMLGAGAQLFPHLPIVHVALRLAALGAELGTTLFVLAICFALLPGARPPPGRPRRFGLQQGIWGMLGFGIVMGAGGILLGNFLTIENFVLIAHHSAARVNLNAPNLLAETAIAGEVMAALWVVWYFNRLGPAPRADGSAAGIAWRGASPRAYAVAALAAFAIIGIVMLMYRLVPPDLQKIETLPISKLFAGSAVTALPLLVIAVFIGPALEEIVFRGIAFGGIAARLGPGWAGVITTLIFIAAHAPEKIYYPPGFIDVGLLAAAAVLLRLRCRSIRPGILMHVLYNAGSMVAASMM